MELSERPQPQEVRRQEIISGSPTLQAIIARDVTQKFLNDRHSDSIQVILERYQSKNFVRRIISTGLRDQARGTLDMKIQDAIDTFTTFGFIDTERNATDADADKLLKQISETLLFAGFEIDDADDAKLVEDDIAAYLTYQDENSGGKFFSDEARDMLKEEGGQILLRNTIYQILLFGINVRAFQTLLPLKGESEQPRKADSETVSDANPASRNEVDKSIRNFINGLPGLENL